MMLTMQNLTDGQINHCARGIDCLIYTTAWRYTRHLLGSTEYCMMVAIAHSTEVLALGNSNDSYF